MDGFRRFHTLITTQHSSTLYIQTKAHILHECSFKELMSSFTLFFLSLSFSLFLFILISVRSYDKIINTNKKLKQTK